jgi:hypothetical protein
LKTSELRPSGSDPKAEADAAIKATKAAYPDLEIPEEAANIFTSSEIDTNISAIGTNAQLDVVANERFFISSRLYGQFFFGPWFGSARVDPTGYSN